LQAPTPADFDDIRAFYERLSPQSRFFRFHGFGRVDTVARAAAEASGVDRLALIGRHEGRVVAAAGYEGLREPGVAEIAMAVADDDQRRGIGTRMLEQLAAIGAERGIRRFDAAVLANNRLMLRVFDHAGFAVRREGFGEVMVTLDITPTAAVLERIDERDHFAAIASLRPVLAPSSVAVMGAADAPGNVGRAVLANISAGNFQGALSAVNRAGGVVCSMRAARTLGELDPSPELVIIAAEEEQVLEFAAEAAASGARALIVVPGGQEQRGDASHTREERLLEIVRDAGLRMVGPNSLGVLNTAGEVSLNATFTGASVRAGGLSICSPSGAVGIGLLGHAAARHLGISIFASLGNRADVSTNDLLEWCEQDELTAAVILYVDTFGNPEHFTRIARRVSRKKPILAIKGRRQAEHAFDQASSHTAAALRGDAVVDALLQQAGVLRFRGGEELFNAAEFFERQPLPSGRRIAIVSNSAGVATLAADACAGRGLEVRAQAERGNPLVMRVAAGPDEYATSVRELLGDPGIDALMVYYVDVHGGDPEAVLDSISSASAAQPKPVVASVVRSDGRRRPQTGSGVPNFLFPESCADVLARAAERREWLSRPLGQAPDYPDLDRAAARGVVAVFLDREPAGGWLSRAEAEALLGTHGIPIRASDHGGGPLLLAPGGADVLVGALGDPDLGPVLAVGLGGLQAGLGRTAARLLPVTDADANELIDASESVTNLLDGLRGGGLLDRDALRELVLRFALLLREAPEVVEADLNPVRCLTSGCVVLDMRLRVEPRRPVDRVKTW